MILAGFFGILAIVLSKKVLLAGISFFFLIFALALGGPAVPAGTVHDVRVYFGLDYFILNLLFFSFIFIVIEKLWGHKREQLIFRNEWQTVFSHNFPLQ